ncbi:hypothetical protein BIFCAT_00558 [Bifidobacterium catenulatum DSM 16992 = JCM 1194 = LMG 11043]|uniref:Uncharacterized protein n=1 Tax=Bifidobacterium catenulatum DSM 16992 = JCM 1194 = LMG 11043 TaxID=566552 RepID=B6XTT0_9BIFI|nr:hypothetical protein BIFCAT_00558 [Bifidobacterium catenulatum DSM 16992 = JCM 1194 = LMG 11043]
MKADSGIPRGWMGLNGYRKELGLCFMSGSEIIRPSTFMWTTGENLQRHSQ